MQRLVLLLLVSSRPALGAVLVRRDGGGVPSSTWVPIIVVLLAVLLAATASIIQRRRHNRAIPVPAAAAAASSSNTQTREVTADQLAGRTTTGTTPSTTTGGAANPPRTRRARRARRTPSQISTKSLPAYNPDAGEQELVIYRAPTNEDSMNTVHETESPRESMDVTTVSTPLMQEHNESDPSIPPGMSRPSTDTLGGSEESSRSLLRNQQPDPRGEAPPYTEISLNDTPESPTHRRMSSIRRLLGGSSSSPTSTRAPILPTHTRNPSSPPRPSVSSSNAPSSPPTSNTGHTRGNSSSTVASGPALSRIISRPSHRPSHSGGSSFFQRSLHHLRPSSPPPRTSEDRLRSSPSMISLNSISAPLSHTLTRTEIQFPAGGPTPDQIRLLSSRESLGRFGVPYGADAVAFASASRVDLSTLPPPPEFDSVVGGENASIDEGLPRTSTSSPTPASTTAGPATTTVPSAGAEVSSSPEISPDSSFDSAPPESEEPQNTTAATATPAEPTSSPPVVADATITSSPPTSAAPLPPSPPFRAAERAPLEPPSRADSALSTASFTTAMGDPRRLSLASLSSFATAHESIAGASIAPPALVVEGPTPVPSRYASDEEDESDEDTTVHHSRVEVMAPRSVSPAPASTASAAPATAPAAAPAVVLPTIATA